MRITYVLRRSAPATGGIENHLRLLTQALPPQERVQILSGRVDDGWPRSTDVLARDAFEPFALGQATTQPLRVRGAHRLGLAPVAAYPRTTALPRGRGWLSRRAFSAFARGAGRAIATAADRPHLIHVLAGGDLAAAGVVAGRRLGVPVVLTPSAHPGQWDDDPLSGRAYRAADLVLAWADADASTYRGLGVPEAHIRISAPCCAALPPGRGAGVRAAHGVTGPLVLFVGLRSPHKGVDLLLAAARAAAADVSGGLTLAFVGHGPALAAGDAALRVIDAGPVDDDEKAGWLEAADVLALPSAYESFGVVVGEAWRFGVPVVTSDIPVLRELVEAAGGGRAVPREPGPLAEALRELVLDRDAARALGRAGSEHWRRELAPPAAARRTLASYAELV